MASFHGPPPSEAVIAAFGLQGKAIPLAGGQGESFVLTDPVTEKKVVIKPATDLLAEVEFIPDMQTRLLSLPTNPAYRIARPVPLATPIKLPSTSSTELTESRYTYVAPSYPNSRAWTATSFISGQGDPTVRPAAVLAASRAFHTDLRPLYPTPPAFLAQRTHRWSWADRYAWSELPLSAIPHVSPTFLSQFQPAVTRLEALLTPVADLAHDPDPAVNTPQLVHGDLSGNLLFDDDDDTAHPPAPPAIIDFSVYFRPVAYAEGVVGADLLLWRKGDVGTLRDLGLLRGVGSVQCLVRAMVFRVVTFAVAEDEAWVARHLGLMDLPGAVAGMEDCWREVCGGGGGGGERRG